LSKNRRRHWDKEDESVIGEKCFCKSAEIILLIVEGSRSSNRKVSLKLNSIIRSLVLSADFSGPKRTTYLVKTDIKPSLKRRTFLFYRRTAFPVSEKELQTGQR
jgi:hypothetical protein